MVEVISVFLGISLVLFVGFIAEFLFKKIHIPDILFLILLGFFIGPNGMGYVQPDQIKGYAPVFTTFALLFLLYDGAFNISLKSLLKGAVKSLKVTMFNFIISVIVVSGIVFAFGFDVMTSLLTGFILGGISSAFVIPILKQLKVTGETYSILTLESAITDVLCIVSAFTVMEIITINSFNVQVVLSKIASLFAVAGLIGIVSGIIWIILVIKVFKEHKFYMITIAYLILVYVVTEFLHGNGAIAALFFGLVLKNSRNITEIFGSIMNKKDKSEKEVSSKKAEQTVSYGISVTTEEEEMFYSQISFFLKTFFFVYIGVLLDISDTRMLIIGGVIAIAVTISRLLSYFVTKDLEKQDRSLIKSIFARGLAAAAIAQFVLINGISGGESIVKITYAVIVFTIMISSVRIFFLKRSYSSA